MKKASVDHVIFWPSIILVIVVTLLLVFFQADAEPFINNALSIITNKTDWVFQFLTVGIFGILLWLAFGRYGTIKLGSKEDLPEFSNFSWGAMLFCASMGTSIMFWSVVEPLYYYTGPPFGIEANSKEAADIALSYGLFHWGVSAWALYTLPAVAIAYSFFVKNNSTLRISSACRGALGRHSDTWVGKTLDVVIIWSMVGGLSTSLGLGVPMISTLIGDLFGIEQSTELNIAIIAIWTVIFSASAYMGLYTGIKKLSDWNVYMALGLAVFVMIVGPTSFIFSYFSNSLGIMIDSFAKMSFYTDPIQKSGFPQSWTVFYWAWFAATAPFIGLFIARISKGRTIRELIFNVLLWGTIGSWLYFAVFGGYAMNLELTGELSLTTILSEQGGPAVILAVLNSLPFTTIVMVFFIILGFIFLSTSLDSATYVIASIATKKLHHTEEPARWQRMVWGIVLAFMAVSLTLIGGLSIVQTSSVLVSIPVVAMYFLLTYSLIKWLKTDFPNEEKQHDIQLKKVN
ncbi:BCCT family transporter [Bacillus sp. V2I10]|uniref:BCCT family transporter n=1 Tax=Bacillus sp. V2I10 TaxID=3042276 RepID=UPI0027820445|nr:BCCT family transporter [Bacillus sp. V2I10]MDQ0862103.1 BCCT family betaine/carnitine transporter [Bacillus sp. V2I10]